MTNKLQGFCDTNIFVDFSLTDKFSSFIERYKILRISDAVHIELQDWDRENYEYSYIYNNLVEQLDSENIKLVEREQFTDLEKSVIERRLNGIYEILDDLPKEAKKHLNKGEIISAIYAEVLKAPFIQSNDKFPNDLKDNEFKNIVFLNRNDILKELCNSLKETSHYNNLINNNRKKWIIHLKLANQ
ncbi:hypothetical protein ATN85_09285 [Staphylococcus hominis]|uniref:hypothetical protein n=1 Tax=Staphylococcus TaxID=1279 RepID=UPI0009A306CF|nr:MULTISPECIES: hypothetical protein [Staphylococcus]OPF66682.1 hypothetical protein ATN85_09285 [Staphylococcus hominis]